MWPLHAPLLKTPRVLLADEPTGLMTLGALIASMKLLADLVAPTNTISQVMSTMPASFAALDRCTNNMKLPSGSVVVAQLTAAVPSERKRCDAITRWCNGRRGREKISC